MEYRTNAKSHVQELGVMMPEDLTFKEPNNVATTTARKLRGWITRTFRRSDLEPMVILINSVVRCIPMGSFQAGSTAELENLKRTFTAVCHWYHSVQQETWQIVRNICTEKPGCEKYTKNSMSVRDNTVHERNYQQPSGSLQERTGQVPQISAWPASLRYIRMLSCVQPVVTVWLIRSWSSMRPGLGLGCWGIDLPSEKSFRYEECYVLYWYWSFWSMELKIFFPLIKLIISHSRATVVKQSVLPEVPWDS